MMTKKLDYNRFDIESISLDILVSKNHLVRKINKTIDFSFIYNEVVELYSAVRAPSVDPVVLIK